MSRLETASDLVARLNRRRRRPLIGVIAVLAAASAGGLAAAQEVEDLGEAGFTVSLEDCRPVTVHVPSPDTAYKPGVDAEGNPVVPADLDPRPDFSVSEPLIIRLSLPLAALADLGLDPRLDEAEVDLGRIVWREGRLYWNGRPLDSAAQNAVARACRDLLADEETEQRD